MLFISFVGNIEDNAGYIRKHSAIQDSSLYYYTKAILIVIAIWGILRVLSQNAQTDRRDLEENDDSSAIHR